MKYAPARPYAFTEQGVAMLSAVLKSDVAVRESIRIMKADALENDVKLLIAKIVKPMTASSVREHAHLSFGRNRGNLVYKHFAEHLADYGFMLRKGDIPSVKLIGTMDMFLQSAPAG